VDRGARLASRQAARLMRRVAAIRLGGALLLLVAIAALLLLARPEIPPPEPALTPPAALPALPETLAVAETRIADLRPDSNRKVVWAYPARRARTPLALVYLHGFAADRNEIAPVADKVAAELGANLYYARIPGHGRTTQAMAESSLEGWLQEGESALAIGKLLGERVVVVGTSTGGTLATWLAARHPEIAAVVLVSPNYAVWPRLAPLAAWPGGQSLVRLVEGDTREFKTHTPLHAKHWTWRYSTIAIPPMMQLLKAVQALDLAALKVPLLALYSPEDTVVRPDAIRRRFAEWGGPKRLQAIETQDPDRHVLAGDALSPGTNAVVAGEILQFLRSLPPRRD
jgi:pimeloyl-ACP methyl ester carboxylesterase